MRSAGTLALAALLAAGCGPGSGADPGPDFIDADSDTHVASADCNDHDARVYWLTDAFRDLDGDGAGGAPGVVCAGMGYLPAGWVHAGGDCDDADPATYRAVPLYPDRDGDGVGEGEAQTQCIGWDVPPLQALGTGDCAPDDPARWQMIPYTHRDADHDGATVPEQSSVCAGASLPPGYASSGSLWPDCDDTNPSRWQRLPGYPDTDGDGVGAGVEQAVCAGASLPAGYALASGDCAPEDGTSWRYLTFWYVDGDADGATVSSYGQVCTGLALPPGFSGTGSGNDCDDADATRWLDRLLYADNDGDGHGAGLAEHLCTGASIPAGWDPVGGDCAADDATRWRPFAYRFRDADGDGRTVPQAGELCLDDGPAPPGYGTVASGSDCDDSNATAWQSVSGYADLDGDGVGVAPVITSCTAGSLPAGQVAASGDCAGDDATRWRLLSYGWADRDGDGFTVPEAGQVCAGAAPPDPWRTVKAGNDCDDTSTALWRWVVLYADQDGDGIGAGSRTIPCLGAALPVGYSLEGWDSDDADPGVQLTADPDSPLALDR